MLERTAKCRSELVRESTLTAAEDLAFNTTPSRTSSLLQKPPCLSVRQNVGANLFAKGPAQPQKIWRSKQHLREQVRSYKSTPCSSVWQKCRSELVRERARTAAEDSALKTTPSRTSSLLQKHSMLERTAKCRSELVRERARTAAEDLAFKTPPSRTSSLLQKHSMLERTAKCRSELVRERDRTDAEDLAFNTTPSRTSSLLQKPPCLSVRQKM